MIYFEALIRPQQTEAIMSVPRRISSAVGQVL